MPLLFCSTDVVRFVYFFLLFNFIFSRFDFSSFFSLFVLICFFPKRAWLITVQRGSWNISIRFSSRVSLHKDYAAQSSTYVCTRYPTYCYKRSCTDNALINFNKLKWYGSSLRLIAVNNSACSYTRVFLVLLSESLEVEVIL